MRQLFDINRQLDSKYTKKIQVPQYLPSNICPKLDELMNTQKYGKLIAHINDADISEEEKKFLRFAASRHIIFNYAKIADYYAHASAEVQKLMEESALVIIDINDAIANGYVKLSKEIADIVETSGRDTKK